MDPSQAIHSVAVIGGGPSGLAAARRLLEAGISVTVFERRAELGGIWFYEEAPGSMPPGVDGIDKYMEFPSPCYPSLKTNLITPIMSLGDYAHREGTKLFVPHRQVLEYLRSFAHEFGIGPRVRCNNSVVRLTKLPGSRWTVTLEPAKAGKSRFKKIPKNNAVNEDFDAVVVCNGHYDVPRVPEIPGIEAWTSRWRECFMHSRYYQDNNAFVSKTVLVIGSGVSAFDLSKEIALVAKKVIQARRSHPADDGRDAEEKLIEQFTRSTLPDNMIQVAEVARFGRTDSETSMPDAEVALMDGTTTSGVDFVLLCTGYKYSAPFLCGTTATGPEKTKSDILSQLITDGSEMHNLHHDIFFIPEPTLAFVGVPQYITTFRMFDFQALAIAAVFSNKATLPTRFEMQAAYSRRVATRLSPGTLNFMGSSKELSYVRSIANWINTPEILSAAKALQQLAQYTKRHAVEICKSRLMEGREYASEAERVAFEILLDRKMAILSRELAKLQTGGVVTASGYKLATAPRLAAS